MGITLRDGQPITANNTHLSEIKEMHAKRTSMPTHKLLNIENMNPEQPVGLYVNCYAGGGQYSLLCK